MIRYITWLLNWNVTSEYEINIEVMEQFVMQISNLKVKNYKEKSLKIYDIIKILFQVSINYEMSFLFFCKFLFQTAPLLQ